MRQFGNFELSVGMSASDCVSHSVAPRQTGDLSSVKHLTPHTPVDEQQFVKLPHSDASYDFAKQDLHDTHC